MNNLWLLNWNVIEFINYIHVLTTWVTDNDPSGGVLNLINTVQILFNLGILIWQIIVENLGSKHF